MNRLFGKGIFPALLAGMCMFSCTDVDPTLGSDLIPDDQQTQVSYMTVTGVDAYLYKVDSIISNAATYTYIGKMTSETFGVTEASWVGQYAPSTFSTEERTFGTNPVVDSLVLGLSVYQLANYGDTTKLQTFSVHEVTHRFQKGDSMFYYSAMDMTGKIDPEPLFVFEYKGSGVIQKKMMGPKVDDLIQRLLDVSGDVYEEGNDSLFVDRFKGLYVKPLDASPTDAVCVSIYPDLSTLTLYTHHVIDPAVDPDKDTTVIAQYSFDQDYMVNFNLYKHDYTGTVMETIDPDAVTPVGYVQGAAGISTRIQFTKEFVDALRSKVPESYKTMLINSATLQIGLKEPTIPNLDASFSRLGSYSNYQELVGTVDYPYGDELSTTYPVTLPYGGYLNRSRNGFTMDISRYIQQIASADPAGDYVLVKQLLSSNPNVYEEKKVWKWQYTLAPSYGQDVYGMGEAVLDMKPQKDNPTPLEVSVVYTLLK